MKNASRLLSLLFFGAQVLILLGLLIESVNSLLSRTFLLDKLYSLALIVLSLIFSALLLQYLIKSRANPFQSLKRFYKKNKFLVLATSAITVLLFFFRFQGLSIFFYGGHALAAMLISSARNGYLSISSLDIFDLGAQYLAWIGQWYFVYLILDWIWSISTKIRKKLV